MIPVPVEVAKSSNVVMVSGKVRINKKDFIVIENYNLRLRGFGAKKVANEFSCMMNQNVSYGDKQTTWSGILLLKTREISYYLIGKTKELDFVRPEFELRGLIIWKLGKKFSKFIF